MMPIGLSVSSPVPLKFAYGQAVLQKRTYLGFERQLTSAV